MNNMTQRSLNKNRPNPFRNPQRSVYRTMVLKLRPSADSAPRLMKNVAPIPANPATTSGLTPLNWSTSAAPAVRTNGTLAQGAGILARYSTTLNNRPLHTGGPVAAPRGSVNPGKRLSVGRGRSEEH